MHLTVQLPNLLDAITKLPHRLPSQTFRRVEALTGLRRPKAKFLKMMISISSQCHHSCLYYPHRRSERRVPNARRHIATVAAKGAVQDELPSDAEVVPLRKVVGSAEDKSGAFEEKYNNIKAVVVGASGKTGQAITRKLLQARNAQVKGLVRDTVAAARLFTYTPKLQLEQADVFQFADLQKKLEGSDILFIATGARPSLDPLGPFNVDFQGTVNLVTAAKQQGISKIVLVSSIGVEEFFFPQNLFFGILFWKKRGEEAVQRSGIDYTIVRPGGLTDDIRNNNIVLAASGTFGLPPKKLGGSISRSQIADVCLQAALDSAGSNKVVEAISVSRPPNRLLSDQLAEI